MLSPFTKEQQSVIIGSMLGNGHITLRLNKRSSFTKSQGIKNKEYLLWHKDFFGDQCGEVCYATSKWRRNWYKKVVINLKASDYFCELREKWYPNGVSYKMVPNDIKLDPFTVAIWFFDKGVNLASERLASFSTYGFTRPEVEFLSEKMERKLGFKSVVDADRTINIKREFYKDFVDMIRPYCLWKCMEGKIAYRDPLLVYLPYDKKLQLVDDFFKKGLPAKSLMKKFGISRSQTYKILRNVGNGGRLLSDSWTNFI